MLTRKSFSNVAHLSLLHLGQRHVQQIPMEDLDHRTSEKHGFSLSAQTGKVEAGVDLSGTE